MKYIRTTDNIYKNNPSQRKIITHIEENGEEHLCLEINLGYSADGYLMTRNERIIKESDNLEELCDRFILKGIDIIYLNGEHTQYRFEGSDEWFNINNTELELGIYGAIWTDKGLIYAAKMNDKKEFELRN